MQNNSRQVISNQTGMHPRLLEVVRKHCNSSLRSPIAAHTAAAFEQITSWLQARPDRPLMLDSGCGTGMSTGLLAARYADANIVGVDRSIHRLEKTAAIKNNIAEIADNACLLQAELVDFWRLALAAGLQLQRHTILYPNPYPKSAHMQRRWHGHGVFPTLLKLGGEIELRSNWRLYLEEFSAAVTEYDNAEQSEPLQDPAPAACAVHNDHRDIEIIEADEPITLFEKKYRASDQALYKLTIRR